MKLYHWSKKDIRSMIMIFVMLLAVLSPLFYLLFFSPTKYGETVACASKSAAAYGSSSIENILSRPEQYQNTPVRLSGKITYYPISGLFLRDGIFIIPLDFSTCKGIAAYERGISALADVKGSVIIADNEPRILVEDFNETAPNWVWFLSGMGVIALLSYSIVSLIFRRRRENVGDK